MPGPSAAEKSSASPVLRVIVSSDGLFRSPAGASQGTFGTLGQPGTRVVLANGVQLTVYGEHAL